MSAPVSGVSSGKPVRLLSIDGGGVRGLSALVLLEQLMDLSNEHRRKLELLTLKPWQIFDMIGGTSTGGLIAIILGRLRLSIPECKKAYLDLSEKAFTPKNFISRKIRVATIRSKFKTEPLEDTIKSLIGNDWESLLFPTSKIITRILSYEAIETSASQKPRDLASETERTADDFYRRDDGKAAKAGQYYRFNVPDIREVGLEEVKKLKEIKDLTEIYLEGAELGQKTNSCAERLARVCVVKEDSSPTQRGSGDIFTHYGSGDMFNAPGGIQNISKGSGNHFPGATFSGAVTFGSPAPQNLPSEHPKK
ncbi:uncharacterized protein FTOL_01862 [Fusarium torulosum]|uniref:PNPLA domain-containing protein n=1 Tax=Fusarium torulosum TaxID=33205 RepID=A0AAE8SE78_9HYPO|nr:uncharacterized protein FTOL_01862 [Fusarium torulosum]